VLVAFLLAGIGLGISIAWRRRHDASDF
jgi:hypothetical protein